MQSGLVQQIIILLKMFNVPSMTYATAGPGVRGWARRR